MRRKHPVRTWPFPPGTEIEIEITALTNMGQGLGRVAVPPAPNEDVARETPTGGWVVLVPFALPQEVVNVRVWRNHKNFSEADLLSVRQPSPHRKEAPCGLFTQCGGCQYQHLEYDEQLRWKRAQVVELLNHLARVEFPVEAVIRSPREYGYRSKITPHFAPPRAGRAFDIGFLRAGKRHAVVDVARCLLATDAINERLVEVRTKVRARAAAGEFKRGATLLLRDAVDGVVTDPGAIIREQVDGLDLRFPAGEFFQNNPCILGAFVRHVHEQARAHGARYLVDAYCGSGLFCLTGAKAFAQAVGVEISEPSIRWARENAATNQITNCEFIVGDAASIFAQIQFPPEETAVVIDPPRKGSDESFLTQLAQFGPRTVVYVSCNPATQMRDLTSLLSAGYELRKVQPFDLFPQTKHLECVITLTRGNADAA